ncbi:hypothetical protein G7K_3528-t2 [Saitoella complicata NRRL Y-17804]|uniref:Large ribosomal subunit protein uL6 alpha-beta domain-containing protein n=2 Tax=Saitoella complicata (strain BCRC 22490 / CBS 7301 / JCM 7358 / NBRC 10748 / NRRL Y-17804) TaxID=698492 RepID=A0A0E9NHU8_SAICN|nr:hypothetical protein G7K_3528-t2 [Saitoella complicata NRRL Y-17804]
MVPALKAHTKTEALVFRQSSVPTANSRRPRLLTFSAITAAKMKDIYKDETLAIPEGVTVEIKARIIKVTGPRGTLEKNLRHVDMEIRKVSEEQIKFVVWHGARKHVACLRTVRSLINNMIIGVTKGFRYKMRYVYAHFPINVNVIEDGRVVEIRNFLGQKVVFKVNMLEGVSVNTQSTQKDELILEGNSLENVSQSAASIQQICAVKNKDIRKFLDGIYVSERTTIVQDERNREGMQENESGVWVF